MKQRYTTQNNTLKTRFLTLTILALLVGGNMAWAWVPENGPGIYRLRSHGNFGNNFDVFYAVNEDDTPTQVASNESEITNFTITSGTYRLIFENTNTIIMNGQIFINASENTDAHLVMELGTPPTNQTLASITLKITGVSPQDDSGLQVAFHINNIQNTDRTKHTITIQGNDPSAGSTENIDNFVYDFANNFVIDGDGPVLQAVDGNTMAPKAKVTTAGNRKAYGMFRIQQGTLNLKNVTIQNFSTTWDYGGTIQVHVNQPNSAVKVDIDHCFFTSIATKKEPVLRLQTNGQTFTNDNVDYRNANIKKSKFEKTFGIKTPPTTLGEEAAVNMTDGTIRSYGNNKTTLEINQCHLNGNYGCPVRWHGCGTTTPMKVYNCLIENNFTRVDTNVNGGGGLLLKGPADIQNCTIRNNRTNGNGGGIYISTYTDFNEGTIDFIPEHTIMKLDPTTVIHNNIAEGNGGGVAIEAIRMNIKNSSWYTSATYLYYTGGYIYWTADENGQPKEPFRVEFQLNGGRIINNKANGGYGGGVYLTRNNETTYFKLVCALDKGEISGNTVATGNGGGVAIYTPDGESNPTTMPTNVKPQNIDVTIGTFGSSNQVLIKENEAVNGGGIYVKAYKAKYNEAESKISISVYDNTVIQENTAVYTDAHDDYGLGGGLFVEEGDLTIKGNATYMPRFYKNTSTNNGGGIYLNSGFILANYCDILENEAGDQNSNDNGHGGGIFVGNGKIEIENTTIGKNISHANGGGLCILNGDISATLSSIQENVATNNGGGIYNEDGKIRFYGSRASLNISQASGGGIFANTGKIFTGPYINTHSQIIQNSAKDSGGGIYNYQGIIMLSGDEIKGNKALNGDGGGICINSGDIIMSGGKINDNAAVNGNGGGVYSGGGNFLIQDGMPVVFTDYVSDITSTSAKANCEWLYQGTDGVIEVGICYSSTNPMPTTDDETIIITKPDNFGSYTANLTDLTSGTTYYLRAYAKNALGTGYGNVITFTANSSKSETGHTPSAGHHQSWQHTPIATEANRTSYTPIISGNKSKNGGGIYVARNDDNPAIIIFSGGKTSADIGQIVFNSASEEGGGIYIDYTAKMQMKGHCQVNANRVPEGKNAGGIYLAGRLYIGEPGTTALDNGLFVNRNFAINKSDDDFADEYQDILNYGMSDEYDSRLNNVYLSRNEYHFSHAFSNSYDDDATVIALLNDIAGRDSEGNPVSSIGFSVNNGKCPVVATAKAFMDDPTTPDIDESDYVITSYGNNQTNPVLPEIEKTYEEYLQHILDMAGIGSSAFGADAAVFDDSKKHIVIHTRYPDDPFHSKYIYLWGCWPFDAVINDPETEAPMRGTKKHYYIKNSENQANASYTIPTGVEPKPLEWEIYSEEGLAWFASYVNGTNSFEKGDVLTPGGQDTIHRHYRSDINPYAKAVLMKDLDMSAHFWVPIGSISRYQIDWQTTSATEDIHSFKGEFDGQGHTITGLDCRFVTGIRKYGLFGELSENAKVKNVFVDGSLFRSNESSTNYYIGGIAGILKGNASISNCEARATFDVTTSNFNESYAGGLVGLTDPDLNQDENIVIHSSMAMPEFNGNVRHMGGLIGQLSTGSELYNSFSNPLFPDESYIDVHETENVYIGGLVGTNNGNIENCYSRLQGDEPVGKTTNTSIFGWVAGSNHAGASDDISTKGGIRFCYIPEGNTDYVKYSDSDANTYGLTTYGLTEKKSGKYGFDLKDQQMGKILGENANVYCTNGVSQGLLPTLNKWVEDNIKTRGYAFWSRTMASNINKDLPVLMLNGFSNLGSTDHIYIDYKASLNNAITAYNSKGGGEIFLYDTPKKEYNGGTDKIETVTENNNANVNIFVHEDVGIKQGDNNTLQNVRVGVSLDNSSGNDLGGKNYDWHMFSSSLKEAAIGLKYFSYNNPVYGIFQNYTTLNNDGITDVNYGTSAYMDPPPTKFYQLDDDTETESFTTDKSLIGYFPTNTPYGTTAFGSKDSDLIKASKNENGAFDLYTYGEPWTHWINLKREGRDGFYDHWHQDGNTNLAGTPHANIPYENETIFVPGKGYMVAINQRMSDLEVPDLANNPERTNMMMADGTLNNGEVKIRATYSLSSEIKGTNLVGNPYQSFLDVNKFLDQNENSLRGKCIYLLDADKEGYIVYPEDGSNNTEYAPAILHPHQAFFIKLKKGESSYAKEIVFNNDMRVAGKWTKDLPEGNSLQHSYFRDGRNNYPLVNLFCYDNNGNKDLTTVEINRPEIGGGLKLKQLRTGKGQIYAYMNETEYMALFAPEGVSNIPIRFQAYENGIFTMKWNTQNGDFHYLHLIDNLTGADIDCLETNEYIFEGKTSDYFSRFKLVFQVTGVPEQGDDDTTEGKTFAFQMENELIVNGKGTLQLFDINGRCLLTTIAKDGQNSITLPRIAAGVYVLRLTGDKQTRIQKIILH